jgi:hypothetical protein
MREILYLKSLSVFAIAEWESLPLPPLMARDLYSGAALVGYEAFQSARGGRLAIASIARHAARPGRNTRMDEAAVTYSFYNRDILGTMDRAGYGEQTGQVMIRLR